MNDRNKNSKHNTRYRGMNPNAKSNRMQSIKVAPNEVIGARKKLYAECKEAGMTDMQALVKCFEIVPK